ncbi:MAG TPA: DnaT-like ssDNA-binding protein [Dissulfurispiraceae bacterium]|nr:DnaT-like ssDNA-binding protein [Dissulfurispiraceae bacterium]
MPITLTVEDGTRPTGANTYASLADADAYWADRGNSTWEDATDDEKAAALIQATDYLNGLPWIGRKVAIRVMAWPRYDVIVDSYALGSDEIPDEVVQATCYMAGEIIGGATPLAATDRPLTKLTAGAVSMEWDAASSQAPEYPALKSILRGYIMAGNTFRLVRA